MGRILMPGGGDGSGISSSDLTAIAGDVIKGKTYMGSDTDDGIGTGTLELTGNAQASDVVAGKTFYVLNPKSKVTGTKQTMGGQTITPSLSQQKVATNGKAMTGNIVVAAIPNQKGQAQTGTFYYGSSYCAIRIPEGYYAKNGASWAPEARCDATQMRSALGATAGKIIRGQTVAGITGTGRAFKQYIGRNIRASSTTRQFIDVTGNSSNRYYLDINLGFYPMSISGVTEERSDDIKIIGYDTYHIFIRHDDYSIGWFNADNDSGIMWNTTHIYIPAGNRNSIWDVVIDGYA